MFVHLLIDLLGLARAGWELDLLVGLGEVAGDHEEDQQLEDDVDQGSHVDAGVDTLGSIYDHGEIWLRLLLGSEVVFFEVGGELVEVAGELVYFGLEEAGCGYCRNRYDEACHGGEEASPDPASEV